MLDIYLIEYYNLTIVYTKYYLQNVRMSLKNCVMHKRCQSLLQERNVLNALFYQMLWQTFRTQTFSTSHIRFKHCIFYRMYNLVFILSLRYLYCVYPAPGLLYKINMFILSKHEKRTLNDDDYDGLRRQLK